MGYTLTVTVKYGSIAHDFLSCLFLIRYIFIYCILQCHTGLATGLCGPRGWYQSLILCFSFLTPVVFSCPHLVCVSFMYLWSCCWIERGWGCGEGAQCVSDPLRESYIMVSMPWHWGVEHSTWWVEERGSYGPMLWGEWGCSIECGKTVGKGEARKIQWVHLRAYVEQWTPQGALGLSICHRCQN